MFTYDFFPLSNSSGEQNQLRTTVRHVLRPFTVIFVNKHRMTGSEFPIPIANCLSCVRSHSPEPGRQVMAANVVDNSKHWKRLISIL